MRTLTCLTGLILLAGPSLGWCQDPGLSAGDEQDERIQRIVEERKRREEALAREPTSLDGGETVNPLLLKSITDNSIGIRFEEKDAYFRILELARQTPLAEQEVFARDLREFRRLENPRYAKRKPDQFPAFVDLFQNPDVYRGRPVSLHGVMRRLTKFDPGPNARGIQDAYEGWVYTDDSQSNPAVVIFLSKPDGLKVGGDLNEEVRLTGYFFKMYGYEAHDVARKAPLLLAGAVEWKPAKPPYTPMKLGPEVYLLITLVILVLGFVMWQGNRREMTSAIHPAEADFSKFPPIEPPIKDPATRMGSRLTEPNDS
jgi:hypothetical protein